MRTSRCKCFPHHPTPPPPRPKKGRVLKVNVYKFDLQRAKKQNE